MVVLEEMCPLTWATHITKDLQPTPCGVRDIASFAIFRPIFPLNGQGRGFNSLEQQYRTEEPSILPLVGIEPGSLPLKGSTTPPWLGGLPPTTTTLRAIGE